MTGNAINAKSEALELRELSSEELDAVSGGSNNSEAQEYKKQSEWVKVVQQILADQGP